MFNSHHFVPWKDWDEWERCYKLLYSHNEESILKGCAIVSAWSAKQNLPISVEVTASMKRELICSKNIQGLSLSIIRFINGVAEPLKNQNLNVPISSIESNFGVPGYIITLRHMATHGRLPTFEFAALAANHALQWLEENYWLPQLEFIQKNKEIAYESVLKYLQDNEVVFKGLKKNTVYHFGINALLNIILNPNLSRKNVEQLLIKKVCDLVVSTLETYPHFANAFLSKLAEIVAQGNDLAAMWLEEFFDLGITPNLSIRRIFNYADPDMMMNADCKNLVDKITESTKDEDPSKWPPLSIGNCPILSPYLTLLEDEYEILTPIDVENTEYQENTQIVTTMKEGAKCEEPTKSEIEIW